MGNLYVDCQYGIAGDMFLSALIDLGADISYIINGLKQLPISEFELNVETKIEKGIAAKQLVLNFINNENETPLGIDNHDNHHEHHGHHHKHHDASQILKMISDSELPMRVKDRSISLFSEIARAEAKIHNQSIHKVQFHEVGAMDSIIDIIGVSLALENLGIDELIFSSLATGQGRINIAHGLYPIPAPATAEILVGVPLNGFSCQGELTTPTGAAFAKVLAKTYSETPDGIIENIGYGAGTNSFPHPNVLRVMKIKKKN
ncbi:uncharacterized protein (TIGR00299 family) protein [Streptococcus moroccensis]|uniref:Uncharacterized protein (TIGR00299 family) protein n=1 Tax=Streptococcus moroccensis TaxID=1451356 RepID=A0ABT9YS37_9STRE|nr:uncharacterized protein (TIGR00299 family) protein [Streptococcus moroccensis]